MSAVCEPIAYSLVESSVLGESPVDRDRGVIKGVKILGIQSRSSARAIDGEFDTDASYSYAPEAMKAAIPLYEGRRVYVDHPEFGVKPNGERIIPRDPARKTADVLGRLVNVHFRDGKGLFGDFEYIKTHPLAEQICEAAERMPELFAFSHNARGVPKKDERTGNVVIVRIAEVKSVDLIGTEPGTTRGLFESEHTMPAAAPKTPKKTAGKEKSAIRRILEEAGMVDDEPKDEEEEVLEQEPTEPMPGEAPMPSEEPAAPADEAPVESTADKINSKAKELILAAVDSGEDSAAVVAKIKEILDKRDKALGQAGAADEAIAEMEGEPPTEEDETKGAAESLARKLREYERRDKALELCESLGYAPSRVEVKALAALSDAEAKAMVGSLKTKAAPNGAAPRSAPSKPLMESRAGAPASGNEIDLKTGVQLLRRGR